MATTLTVSSLRASVAWTFEDVETFGNSTNTGSFTHSKTLSNGTGAGASNLIYVVQDDTGIGTSSSTTIDLQSLTDMFGNSISFSKIKVFYLENTVSAVGVNLVVGAAAATQWASSTALISTTDATVLVPSASVLYCARTDATGWVVDGTHKSLKIANASGTTAATYKLVIVGE